MDDRNVKRRAASKARREHEAEVQRQKQMRRERKSALQRIYRHEEKRRLLPTERERKLLDIEFRKKEKERSLNISSRKKKTKRRVPRDSDAALEMNRAYSRETTRKWRAKRKEDAQRKQRKWKREQNKLREKSAKEAHADNLNIISKGDLLRNLELASRLPDYLAEAHRDYLYALRYGEDGPSFLLKKRRLQKAEDTFNEAGRGARFRHTQPADALGAPVPPQSYLIQDRLRGDLLNTTRNWAQAVIAEEFGTKEYCNMVWVPMARGDCAMLLILISPFSFLFVCSSHIF